MKNLHAFLLSCLLAMSLCLGAEELLLSNKTLAPGETLSSDYQELPTYGEVQWALQCDGQAEGRIVFFDIVGKPLETVALSGSRGLLAPSPLAAGFVLQIENTGKTPLVLHSADACAAAARQNYQDAEWIWEPTSKETPGAFAVFRTDFQIRRLKDVKEAYLYITADDRVISYLNETYLEGPHSGGYDVSDSFEIKHALRQGKNTLTCRVLNGGGPGGLLCELHLVDEDGRHTVIPSSADTWFCAPVTEDADWKNAPAHSKPLLHGKSGCQPWGKLYYQPVTQFAARLEDLNVPEFADENTVWTPKAFLRFLGDTKLIGADSEFSIRLRNATCDYLIAETILSREALAADREGLPLELADVHFRYIPDGVYSLDIKLTNADFSLGKLPAITVRRSADASLGLPDAAIVDKDSIPRFRIDGKEELRITQYLVDNAQSAKAFREYKRAFDAGIPTLWLHHTILFDNEGNPDFRNLDDICTTCLARNPDICIVVNPALDNVQSPQMTKFFEEHPEALCLNQDGKSGIYNDPGSQHTVQCACLASELWRQEAERLLGLLIDHMEKMPYGRRVVAIAPSAGITWEWMYWGSERTDECADYSPVFLKGFQEFARAKYGTVELLNRAWKKDYEAFEEIAMPAMAERMDQRDLDLRLPADGTMLPDLSEFFSKTISDDIIRFCSFIKEKTQGRTLTCVYYGYYNMITVPRWSQGSGHWALSRVLDSDAVDMIQAPSTYIERGPGGPGGFMPPESAIHAKGKVFVTESDIRTHHSSSPLGLCGTLSESRGVLEREFGSCLANQVAMRFYDFSLGWTFCDTRLAHLAQLFSSAEEEILAANPRILAPEDALAVVISESATPFMPYYSPILGLFVAQEYQQLARSGLAFNVYITPGLEAIPEGHRFWYFENPIRMTREEIDYVKTNILKPGNTVIFAYGTNVLTSEGLSTKTLEEFTGMQFSIDTIRKNATARLTPEGKTMLGMPVADHSLDPLGFAPKFYPADNCEVLAKDEHGNIVLAQNQVNGCRVIFSSLPCLPSSWLRNIAKQGGLLCYNEMDGDTTWASGDVVTIHTPQPGERLVHSRHKTGTAKNLLTGEEIPIRDGAFTYKSRKNGTDVFLMR